MSNDTQTVPHWLPKPESMEEAVKMATFLCQSNLVPEHYKNDAAALLLAADYAHSVGLPLFSGLRAIYVVSGKAAISSEGMLAVCAGKPDFRDIHETVTGTGGEMVASCTITRGDRTPCTRTFSMAEANAAGLGRNAMYGKWPKRMLAMRARAFALRDCYADALAGCGACAEEIADVYDVTDPAAWAVPTAGAQPVHQGAPPPAQDDDDARPRRGRPPGSRNGTGKRSKVRKQAVVVEAAPEPSSPLPGQRSLPGDAAPGGQPPGWAERLASAPSLDALAALGRDVSAAVTDGPELGRLRRLYAERQQQLMPAMPDSPGEVSGLDALRRRAAERGNG